MTTSEIVDTVYELLEEYFPSWEDFDRLHAFRTWRICDYDTELSVEELTSAVASTAMFEVQ